VKNNTFASFACDVTGIVTGGFVVAWMRAMGSRSVDYHEENVLNRADDHPGQALDYYGSRGETPLRWGGSGARMLDLEGEATVEEYRAIFGPGGARLPRTGAKLVTTRTPGIELVVSPHKSIAELGILGRAEDMHAIVDAERDATMAYLDKMVRRMGGRRGEQRTPTSTGGLAWATSRHATTRAGDPQVHDHVLVANLVWMRDERRGWKALDTVLLRDQLHAATATGRLAAARKAVELGYAIEPDAGRTGRLGGWKIAGFPETALAVHSKRAKQIDDLAGPDASYRERNAIAREKRDPKRHEMVGDLVRRWRAELTEAGFGPAELWRSVVDAAARRRPVVDRADDAMVADIVDHVLQLDSRLSAAKVFDRSDVIVAVAPHLHGLPVLELDRVVDAVIVDVRCVPLIGVVGARTQVYATAATLAAEDHIAAVASELAGQAAASVTPQATEGALAATEAKLAMKMTPGQRQAARGLLTSGAGLELVVGVAGSGKSTMLAAVTHGFTACGYTVIGTATSGQAARGLGEEAGIGESRTVASLCWRLAHERIVLGPRHVLVLDEAGATDDPDFTRLLTSVQRAKAKLIVAGDDRQLSPVGPGGALAGLVRRHPDRRWELTTNVRQRDPAERQALAELRAGKVHEAVDWYGAAGRVVAVAGRDAGVAAMVEAWAADIAAGKQPLLLAWRRADVEALNLAARHAYARMGGLRGPSFEAPGGRCYRVGERVLMLTPGPEGAWVTSERATVTAVRRDGLTATTPDGRALRLDGEAANAERLTYAYAMTAHRSQGSTSDTTHVLEGGGGRELAYVAMSRAREGSHVYVTADGPDAAAEQLRWAWGAEKRQRWALDQGQSAVVSARDVSTLPANPAQPAAGHDPERAFATLLGEQRKLETQIRDGIEDDARPGVIARISRRRAIEDELQELERGSGRFEATPAGFAVRELRRARAELKDATFRAEYYPRFFARRGWKRMVPEVRKNMEQAEREWARQVQPRLNELKAELRQLSQPRDAQIERALWIEQHPAVAARLDAIGKQIVALARDLEQQRHGASTRYPAVEQSLDVGL
jgi:conjugative relaxase-like TrwC/TraI family protein